MTDWQVCPFAHVVHSCCFWPFDGCRAPLRSCFSWNTRNIFFLLELSRERTVGKKIKAILEWNGFGKLMVFPHLFKPLDQVRYRISDTQQNCFLYYRKVAIYRHSRKPCCYMQPHAENGYFLSYVREKNNAMWRHEELAMTDKLCWHNAFRCLLCHVTHYSAHLHWFLPCLWSSKWRSVSAVLRSLPWYHACRRPVLNLAHDVRFHIQ
jgi:hypothetical protein